MEVDERMKRMIDHIMTLEFSQLTEHIVQILFLPTIPQEVKEELARDAAVFLHKLAQAANFIPESLPMEVRVDSLTKLILDQIKDGTEKAEVLGRQVEMARNHRNN